MEGLCVIQNSVCRFFFFFFFKQSQICKYFYFALSFMNVALVDSQVFPGKEASCTYEIAVFKLRNQRKKKEGKSRSYT